MDLTIQAPRFAKSGETLIGNDFYTSPGGKGANQAVATAKLGMDTTMYGRVGNDIFGEDLIQGLINNGVYTKGVLKDNNNPSGVALITVDEKAENQIIIVPGANASIDETDLERLEKDLINAEILLLQLEIPIGIVVKAAKMAKSLGIRVILDLAPAQKIPEEIFSYCDLVTPNETEAFFFTGIEVINEQSARKAAKTLLDKGTNQVRIKMSDKGSFWTNGKDEIFFKAFSVNAIDTVGAGDAFNGGLAAALVCGKEINEALRWASACGALSTLKKGAQYSMPQRSELDDFLSTH